MGVNLPDRSMVSDGESGAGFPSGLEGFGRVGIKTAVVAAAPSSKTAATANPHTHELVVAEAREANVEWRGRTASKRAAATAVRRAMPIDPPTCWLAFRRAEATPVSPGETPPTARDVIVT